MSCGEIDNSEKKSDFFYSDSEREIELIFENYASHLKIEKSTKAKFKTKGVNDKKLIIFGAGITMNQTENDGYRFVITPLEEYLKNGILEIQVSEGLENGETFDHIFKIPVKNTTD